MPVRSGFPPLPSPAAGFVDPRGLQGNQIYVPTHEFYSFLAALRSWNPSLPIISATNYNIKADGVTNEAGLVQTLFDTVRDGSLNPKYTGGLVVFPPGQIYLGSTGIVSNYGITATGAGQGFTQPALYPTANANATWFVSDKTSGNVLEFHTKNPLNLSNFGIVMPASSSAVTAKGIYVDKYDPLITDPGEQVAVNFNSRITNVTTTGGGTGFHFLDCGAFDISGHYIQNWAQIGIYLENDDEAPDSGDGSVHDGHIQSFYKTQGSGILVDHVGGLALGPNLKVLGGQYCVRVRATIAGQTFGEVNIHDSNLEAAAVNAVRIEQATATATMGGVNVMDTHINCGQSGVSFQGAIVAVTNGASNYLTRGKFNGNDIIYDNAAVGSNAFEFETGTEIEICENTLQIPADNHILGTNSQASNITFANNHRVVGPTTHFAGLTATTQVIHGAKTGVTVAQLPAIADGSRIYASDAKRTSATDPTAIGGGAGGWCERNGGVWQTLQPN
jgi:hypothetical protein